MVGRCTRTIALRITTSGVLHGGAYGVLFGRCARSSRGNLMLTCADMFTMTALVGKLRPLGAFSHVLTSQ